MRNSLLILLFLIGTAIAFGPKSESSCEENSNKELVCSEEVLEIIKKENPEHKQPAKKKIANIETTAAPPERPERPESPERPEIPERPENPGKPENSGKPEGPANPEGPVDGGDEYEYGDEYYDDEYYDEEYYDDEY